MNRHRITLYPWLLSILFSFSMLNCQDFGEIGPVNFYAMDVGQHSQYVRFKIFNRYDSTGGTMVIYPDTLLLQVVARRGRAYQLEESYDSISHYYLVTILDNSTIVSSFDGGSGGPQIFYAHFLPSSPLQLPARIDSPEFHMVGWRTVEENCTCDRTGYLSNYSQFGRQYPHANVFIANEIMNSDGSGYTCVYTPNDGVLRSSLASAWTQTIDGWFLIR